MNEAIKRLLKAAIIFVGTNAVAAQEVRLKWKSGEPPCHYTVFINPAIKQYVPLLFETPARKIQESGKPIIFDCSEKNPLYVDGYPLSVEQIRSGLEVINSIATCSIDYLSRYPISLKTIINAVRVSRGLLGFDYDANGLELVAVFALNRELLENSALIHDIHLALYESCTIEFIKNNMASLLELLSSVAGTRNCAQKVLREVIGVYQGTRGRSEEYKNSEAIFNRYFKNNEAACKALALLYPETLSSQVNALI